MRIYLTEDKLIDKVEERDLLIMGNDGANVIEVYNLTQDNQVTVSFKRSDGLIVHELPLQKEAGYHFYTITNDTGILAVAGELQISLHIREKDKLINTTIVTAMVMPSITITSEDQNWYINLLAEEVMALKAQLTNKDKPKVNIEYQSETNQRSNYEKEIYEGQMTNKIMIPKATIEDFNQLLISYGIKNNIKTIMVTKTNNQFNSTQDIYIDFNNHLQNAIKLEITNKEAAMLIMELKAYTLSPWKEVSKEVGYMITRIIGVSNGN